MLLLGCVGERVLQGMRKSEGVIPFGPFYF